ncbi:hypothetical protein DFH09DRAFT_1427476 [Mycena vulgaris]|nr:hypothetical protein DFH09DRAFT_1427476 [Mycena vulgaris]
MRSVTDNALIDGLPTRVVIAFRNSIYQSEYVASNASMFLDNDWINMDQLKHFLARPDTDSHSSDTLQTRVKLESDASTRLFAAERQVPSSVNAKIKTRTLKEGNKEVLEILSDSDSEVEDCRGGQLTNSDDFLPRSDAGSEATYVGTDLDDNELSADESESEGGLQDSDTLWLDDGLSSRVRVGEMRVTGNVTVQRVEYVPGLPSAFPIPEIATAFVVDLHDAQYNLTDKHGKLITNDSFEGPTGTGDSKVLVTFESGQPPILCRGSRLGCKGSYACEHTDTALLDVVRRNLHPATRDVVFAAQRETRRQEGRTPEQRVMEFLQLVRNRACTGNAADGGKCKGIAVLRTKTQKSRGHSFWLGCSGWTSDNTKHTGISIPDDVDPDLFLAGFNGQPLAADTSKDTPLCSAIVHPTTGLKSKKCAFTHIVNGEPHTKSAIMKRPCPVQRRIYIPMDPSIRKALIVHPGNIAHNHPIPAFKKVSHEHKAVYKKCIQAAGCVGATVAKVDNAPSTKLLLGGKKPGEFAAALQSSTVKQKLVHETKLEAYPEGLGVKGAFQLFFEDMKKGVDERYIQRIAFEKDGGVIILTCLASLMRLLDDAGVTSFEDDTTFKRIAGEFNEWETNFSVLQPLPSLEPISMGPAPIFYESLYNKFQEVKLELTGKPVRFKRFIEGGSILAMNSDMEAAQVLGATRSLSKLNKDEAYSNLAFDTPPEQVAPEIIKLCTTHAKRAVLDFETLVSADDYKRLMDFVYIDSEEGIDEFSEFVRGLGIKKIQDWWDHKAMSAWILPCLVKSQSPMSADDWVNTPATTNTGEAQHAWTNSRTGIGLSLVEAMERKLDNVVAREIEISIKSGVLLNSRNESSHRRARNSTRNSTRMRKSHEASEQSEELDRIALKKASLQEQKKQVGAELKDLQVLKKTVRQGVKASQPSSHPRRVLASSSSSGRICLTSTPAFLRTIESPVQPVASTSTATTFTAPFDTLPPATVQNVVYGSPDAFFTLNPYGFADSPVLDPPNFNTLQTFDFSFLQDFGTLMLNGAVAAPDFQQSTATSNEFTADDYNFLFAPIPKDPVAPSLLFEPQPPLSPSTEWPRLPPVPLSSPPHPEPAPVAPQLELPPLNAFKKREARAEVDQANAIYTKRPRKTPRRRDE